MKRLLLLCSISLALLSACGGFPPPTERLNTAEGAIRGAQEVGAQGKARAALHLKLAQEQTEEARQLMQDGYNERADYALRRAQADAELAIAIVKEEDTKQRAEEMTAKLEKARSEAMTTPSGKRKR